MSRLTRDSSRRRASLLATSSFFAASLLAGAGGLSVTMTPSVALANGECTTNGPGIVVCNPGAYLSGITYTATLNNTNTGVDGTTLLLNSDTIEPTKGQNGVTLTNTVSNEPLAVTLVIQKAGTASTFIDAFTGGNGIDVASTGSNIQVSTDDVILGGGGRRLRRQRHRHEHRQRRHDDDQDR